MFNLSLIYWLTLEIDPNLSTIFFPHPYQVVGTLADRTIILIRAKAVIALHLAVIQGGLAGVIKTIEGSVRRRWAVGTALAGIGWYCVLAGLAHGRLAGRSAVFVADASYAVALLPLLAEFPRDTLVNTVLRLLLEFRPGDQICKERPVKRR